jgi:hypothetical protein
MIMRYPLVGSFVTIPDAPKAIDSNSLSVFPRKSRWVSAVILATISNELTKLFKVELI